MPAAAGMDRGTAMTTRPTMADAGLYRLLAWLSPGFPVGAFSYSHGLETAVEWGEVADAHGLRRWIGALVARGSGFVDAVWSCAAHRATAAADAAAWCAINAEALAWRGTAETALESRQQGRAFLRAVRAAWPHPSVEAVLPDPAPESAYSVTVGTAAAAAGVPAETGAVALLHGFAANLVSAGVRLVPLGQTDGQRVLAALEPLVLDAAARAAATDPASLGTATPMAELASMGHETQYTRLFRS